MMRIEDVCFQMSIIDNCIDDVMSGFDDVFGLDVFEYFIYLSVFGIKKAKIRKNSESRWVEVDTRTPMLDF